VIRRFVYSLRLERVVELEQTVRPGLPPRAGYDRTLDEYRSKPLTDRETAGTRLREAALERADRRVYAHKRFGDEMRWTET